MPIPLHAISKRALTPARPATPFAWYLRFLKTGQDAVPTPQGRPTTDEVLPGQRQSPNWRSHQPRHTEIKHITNTPHIQISTHDHPAFSTPLLLTNSNLI